MGIDDDDDVFTNIQIDIGKYLYKAIILNLR